LTSPSTLALCILIPTTSPMAFASSSARPDIDGTTAHGGSHYGEDSLGDIPKTIPKVAEKSRAARIAHDVPANAAGDLPFVDSEQYLDSKRPFCVKIDNSRGGVVGALKELDTELRQVSST
jgi:hypothetical protein